MPNNFLEWTDNRDQQHFLEIVNKVFIDRCCVGIDDSKCIIIQDPAVSRDHAIISLEGTRLYITDMSRNGVWINNTRMAVGSLRELNDWDVIGVGDTKIIVRYCQEQSACDDIEKTVLGTFSYELGYYHRESHLNPLQSQGFCFSPCG